MRNDAESWPGCGKEGAPDKPRLRNRNRQPSAVNSQPSVVKSSVCLWSSIAGFTASCAREGGIQERWILWGPVRVRWMSRMPLGLSCGRLTAFKQAGPIAAVRQWQRNKIKIRSLGQSASSITTSEQASCAWRHYKVVVLFSAWWCLAWTLLAAGSPIMIQLKVGPMRGGREIMFACLSVLWWFMLLTPLSPSVAAHMHR